MKIAIGCDHAGYAVKEVVIALLKEQGIEVHDKGAFSAESVDYPDFVHPVAVDMVTGKADRGIVICGSGNGVAMTINKYAQVRCGLCWTIELAELTRKHNNANAIALPAKFIDLDTVLGIVKAFIDTPFEGGRHQRRVDKISPDIEYMC